MNEKILLVELELSPDLASVVHEGVNKHKADYDPALHVQGGEEQTQTSAGIPLPLALPTLYTLPLRQKSPRPASPPKFRRNPWDQHKKRKKNSPAFGHIRGKSVAKLSA